MGKIKGWTKKRSNKVAETWVLESDTDTFVDLVLGNINRPYYVFMGGSVTDKKGFTSYKKAKDYAMKYMRSYTNHKCVDGKHSFVPLEDNKGMFDKVKLKCLNCGMVK